MTVDENHHCPEKPHTSGRESLLGVTSRRERRERMGGEMEIGGRDRERGRWEEEAWRAAPESCSSTDHPLRAALRPLIKTAVVVLRRAWRDVSGD